MSDKALAGKRILVTNDDGIHAPGLAVLERIAARLSDDVWVVAPETEQSGTGHSLTLTRPLRLRSLGDQRFAVAGTPTDCVVMAMDEVLAEHRPDLVLSGVNRGGNLADDVTYSGTIAAAMEGTMFRVPSIALSQRFEPDTKVPWNTAETHAPALVARLYDAGWPEGVLMNVNFPSVPAEAVAGLTVATQGSRDISGLRMIKNIDPRGVPYYWFGFGREMGAPPPETDLAQIASGKITVTPLHLDLTHFETLPKLRAALEGLETA